jgi:membrane dipeptidase
LVKEVQDIQRVKQEQKVGMILCMQNSKPVWDDLGLLTIFKNLGMRVIQLTNNSKTPIGDGCYERTDCGLGDFGIKMVEEMNRIGLLIDLSHVGRKTSLDAIEISKDPVAFSHSSAKSLVDHVRNLTDEQIKAVAEKKGVVGITTGGGSGSLIRSGGNATIDDFLNHVDYVVNLVGADYVGVGIDFPAFRSREKYEAMKRVTPEIAKQVGQTYEEYARGVRGLAGPLEYPGIAEGLVSRGYSDGDIKKILGENFLRLFNRVWKPS